MCLSQISQILQTQTLAIQETVSPLHHRTTVSRQKHKNIHVSISTLVFHLATAEKQAQRVAGH